MKRVLIGGAIVAALVVVLVASLRTQHRGKATRVYVEEVKRGDIARVVKASGQIDPKIKVNISSHVIGKIDRLYVKEGETIGAGEPFLELEKESFVAARDQAAAQLAIARSRRRQAEISLQDAQLKLRRMERLATEQIASAEQLEAAQLQEVSARLALEQSAESVAQSQAALDKALDDLSKATIYSPISGRVVELRAKQGEVVVSGTMNNPASIIGTIADLSEILAEVDVDETEVVYLAPGQRVRLEVDALPDRNHDGRLVETGSSGFQRPQQPDVTFFKAKVLLDQPDPDLRPGMSVRAEIETAKHSDALVVPIQAVVDRPPLEEGENNGAAGSANGPDGAAGPEEISVVFVVEDDTARQKAVEIGLTDATLAEIVSGLEAGAKVVTGPYRSLKSLEDGERVRVRDQREDEDDNGGDQD